MVTHAAQSSGLRVPDHGAAGQSKPHAALAWDRLNPPGVEVRPPAGTRLQLCFLACTRPRLALVLLARPHR